MYDRKELKIRQAQLRAELAKVQEVLDNGDIKSEPVYATEACGYAQDCCAVQEKSSVRSFENSTESYLAIAHDIAGNILNSLIGSPPDQMKACNPSPVSSVPVMATAEMNTRSAETLVRRLHELASLIS